MFDFLVDTDVDLNTSFSLSLDQFVQSVLLLFVRGAAEEELGRQPPVGNVYRLFGVLKGNGNGPEIVPTIDIPEKLVFGLETRPIDLPFHAVAGAHREIGFVAVLLTDGCALIVATLLMLLIVPMVFIKLKRHVCKLRGSR